MVFFGPAFSLAFRDSWVLYQGHLVQNYSTTGTKSSDHNEEVTSFNSDHYIQTGFSVHAAAK